MGMESGIVFKSFGRRKLESHLTTVRGRIKESKRDTLI